MASPRGGRTRRPARPFRLQRGISLLEVMFSIGIVTIGLLGVAALFPLAGRQVARALTADTVATYGRNAVQQFDALRMRDATTWLLADGTPGNGGTPVLNVGIGPGSAFCIDPRFVAVHNTANAIPFDQNPANFFPYDPPTPGSSPPDKPRMYRVSLPSNRPGTTNEIMSQLLANELFVSDDDITFSLPEDDATLPPVQTFAYTRGPDGEWGQSGTDDDGDGVTDNVSEAGFAGSDDVLGKREYDGAYSWMATLVPIYPQTDGGGSIRDLYTLSVVVFHQRSSGMEIDAFNERVVNVDQASLAAGSGVNGGPLTLTAGSEEALKLRTGDWVMLSSFVRAIPAYGVGQPVPAFRWYRVGSVDPDIVQVNNSPLVFARSVTLHGPDWTRPEWQSGAAPTQCTIMTGVAAVYEKTIRLETTSLWSP